MKSSNIESGISNPESKNLKSAIRIPQSAISAVILAGGENKRFPTLKGFIKIDGIPIIERTLGILRGMFDEVLISTNMPEAYFYLGAPMVGDVLPSSGPMTGIYSSLLNAKGDSIFVIACDMPFINADIVRLVCNEYEKISKNANVDAAIPVYDNEPQPLFGVYCKTSMSRLEKGILEGKTALKRFLGEINTHLISASDIKTIDFNGRSFVNINTAEDYKAVVSNA